MVGSVSPVLEVRGLCKSFGAVRACRDVTLDLRRGEIHALIGPNGAGKSTLIQQISGGIRPDAGTIHFADQEITQLSVPARARLGLARSFQVSAVVPEYSVLENLLLTLHGRAGSAYRLLGRGQARGLAREAWAHAQRVKLHGHLNVPANRLAHGERRRLEIAMSLALAPRAFLLDEPMAGLGRDGTEDVVALLAQLKHEAPILLVEHDMDAVFELADRISVLVYGEIIATGSVEDIRSDPRVRQAYLGEEAPV